MALENVLLIIWASFVASLPGLIAAIVTLIIGLIIGKVVGRVVKEILIRVKIDKYVYHKEKMAFKISDVFSLISRWWIYLVFIQQAAVFLGVAVIMDFVNSVISFIPGLVEASLIIIIGYVLAEYIKDKIVSSKTLYADMVGNVIFFLLIYISIALALPFINIDPSLINNILLILIASIGLGMAIAIGFGLKDVIAQAAKQYTKKFRR